MPGWASSMSRSKAQKKRPKALGQRCPGAFLSRRLRGPFGQDCHAGYEGGLFSYSIDEQTLRLAQLMDGKLLVVTNVQDLVPGEVIERYNSLADIKRGFNVLKSELEIGLVYTVCQSEFAPMPRFVS